MERSVLNRSDFVVIKVPKMQTKLYRTSSVHGVFVSNTWLHSSGCIPLAAFLWLHSSGCIPLAAFLWLHSERMGGEAKGQIPAPPKHD